MLVQYSATSSIIKETGKKQHPRGVEIFQAIELDLSRDPTGRGVLVKHPNQYAQVFTPEVLPAIEIRVVYLVTDKNILVTKIIVL